MAESINDILDNLPNPQNLSKETYEELKKLYLAIRRIGTAVAELQVTASPSAGSRVLMNGALVTLNGEQVYDNVTA